MVLIKMVDRGGETEEEGDEEEEVGAGDGRACLPLCCNALGSPWSDG